MDTTILFSSLLGIYGGFIGSFLGVIIDRLPEGRSIFWGRSQCDYCKKTLRWFELIPVFSFIIQLGKCRRCKRRLSFKYPLIEICSAILFVFVWFFVDFYLLLYIPAVIVASSLLVIVFIDTRHMIIPDSLLVVGVIGTTIYHLIRLQSIYSIVLNHLTAGILSFFLFYVLWEITRRKGIGFGDVKLVFLLGFITGFPSVIVGIYLSFLTGALVGLILLLSRKKTMKSPVPFGPFLIVGAVVSLLIDPNILIKLFL